MKGQQQLLKVAPRFTLSPVEVALGRHWLPLCRQALAQATEVHSGCEVVAEDATEVHLPLDAL